MQRYCEERRDTEKRKKRDKDKDGKREVMKKDMKIYEKDKAERESK